MTEQPTRKMDDINVDLTNLYREDMYTDLKVASIRCLTPIKPDGSDDPDRSPTFIAQTQVYTGSGLLPIEGEIEAATLEEACQKFPEAIQDAMERMAERAREMQREQANRIVVPGQDPMGGGMPPMGGGGSDFTLR